MSRRNRGNNSSPNDLMMVLEAMRMETQRERSRFRQVKVVNGKAGDAVKVNQTLVEFE